MAGGFKPYGGAATGFRPAPSFTRGGNSSRASGPSAAGSAFKPFAQFYGNSNAGGQTPQEIALQNLQAVSGLGGGGQTPYGLAGGLVGRGSRSQSATDYRLGRGGANDTRTLQEANAAQAFQAARVPLQQYYNDPVQQATQKAVLEGLEAPPTYLQEQARAGETAAVRQLDDARAAGQISDLEYRQRKNNIMDTGRRTVSQLTQAGRQQAISQGAQYAQQQQNILQNGVRGIVDVLSQIQRYDDSSGGIVGGGGAIGKSPPQRNPLGLGQGPAGLIGFNGGNIPGQPNQTQQGQYIPTRSRQDFLFPDPDYYQ